MGGKRLQVAGHEQKAAARQQATEPGAAVFGCDKQRAYFAGPVLLGHELEYCDLFAHAQSIRLVHCRGEAIGVEGFEPTHPRHDAAGADNFTGIQILEDKQVELGLGRSRIASKTLA